MRTYAMLCYAMQARRAKEPFDRITRRVVEFGKTFEPYDWTSALAGAQAAARPSAAPPPA